MAYGSEFSLEQGSVPAELVMLKCEQNIFFLQCSYVSNPHSKTQRETMGEEGWLIHDIPHCLHRER
jgi:hypothetical protein